MKGWISVLPAAALMALAGAAAPSGGLMTMQVRSTAFAPGAEIPRKHTCDGEDVSPALAWSGAPAGVVEFAVVCDDPDAPGGTFVHWVIWGIPGDRSELPEGVPPAERVAALGNARQGRNGFGARGYRGPCPPRGNPHRYVFQVYALSAAVEVPSGAGKAELEAAMKGHVLARGELVGTYGRR
jgi:Raf kinase inhibitor-like YbhB/YbcL family protein